MSLFQIIRAGKGRHSTWEARTGRSGAHRLYHRDRLMLRWADHGATVRWIRRGQYRRGEATGLQEALWVLYAPYMVTKRRGRYRAVGPAIIDWLKHPEETW